MARIRPSLTLATGRVARVAKASPRSAVAAATTPAKIVIDRYRAFIFPNRIREQRRRLGLQKLMALSELLPDIPYIRLSKIERGEVVARAGELHRIAQALGIAPADLLTDVSQSGFDIAIWALPFLDGRPAPEDEECFAVMLAAALRALRNSDAAMTIAALDQQYGLPAVILSRLENAHKTVDRWNPATIAAVCRLFGVADEAALRVTVTERYRRGELDGYVGRIADPATRALRTQALIAALRKELSLAAAPPGTRGGGAQAPSRPIPAEPTLAAKAGSDSQSTPAPPAVGAASGVRMLPVYGAALPGGLIAVNGAGSGAGAFVEAPPGAGPRAFGLRVCRATLGAGLPAAAIVVVDPDRAPVAGSLAAIRAGDAYRLLSVTFDRLGATKGYSLTPDLEINIDELDPADVAAVIAAIFP